MENSSLAVISNSPKAAAGGVWDDIMDDNLKTKDSDENSNITRNDFPASFIFGTGTAAYQHEGAAAKGGRGPSIWDTFALGTPARIADGSNGNKAVDMYYKFREDIKMMKKMGFDAYRFSISWSRILPGGRCSAGINQEGIDYYNDVINTVLANGLEPYVTLFHFDLPRSLQEDYGGFLSKKVVIDFREYVELCFWEFGDRVKHWITVNEPLTYSVHGYADCTFPPGAGPSSAFISALTSSEDFVASSTPAAELDPLSTPPRFRSAFGSLSRSSSANNGNNVRNGNNNNNRPPTNVAMYRGIHDLGHLLSLYQSGNKNENTYGYNSQSGSYNPKNAYTCARNLLLAHSAAVHTYRTKFQELQEGKIGITLVSSWFQPYSKQPEDVAAAKRALDFSLGWFLEPLVTGNYPQNMIDFVPPENLAPFTKHESEMLKGSFDFLGLNYYTANYAANDPDPQGEDGYFKDQQVKYYTSRDNVPIGPVAGSDWLFIVPWGIHRLLMYTKETYSNLPPIYITENGVDEKNNYKLTAVEACHDPTRIKYHQDHLAYVLKAMGEGVDVRGYFVWSWCDNFEWTEGYTVRFGIIHVDFLNDLTRYAKDSAVWFMKFLTKKKYLRIKKRQNIDAEDNEPEKRLKTMEE